MTNVLPALTPPPERIRSPLAQVRGTILRYVAIDGALLVALFAVCWFWLDLALDYGSFKLFAFDWVLSLPAWFRGSALAALTGVITLIIAFRVVGRFLVEFRPAALALVLEKRFPAALGDRLITAVELSDLDRAERQGYSRAMIEETVREAGERVAAVRVSDVFAWGRLKFMGKLLAALAVFPFVVFGAAYSGARQTNPARDYLPRFREVATIWAKRDLLLLDVMWPRKAYLEVLDFPAGDELRIGRDAPSPRLRFKARRWVLADATAPEGWRPMLWTDLRPGLLGGPPPALPSSWLESGLAGRRGAAVRAAGLIAAPGLLPFPATEKSTSRDVWTLDEVDIALEDDATVKRLEQNAPAALAAIRQVFETLAERANDSGSRAVYRRLDVPRKVFVKYWNDQTSSRIELDCDRNWEYVGSLGELKESIKFWARAEDYYTPTKAITLVPPPSLQQLTKIEYRPAYLYHRPPLGNSPEGGPAALRGLRQRIEDQVSLNGPTSRISVPFGTDLILEGQLDKELAEVRLRPRGKGTGPESTVELTADKAGFRHRFSHLTEPVDCEFEFADPDHVKSARHVVVDVVRDLPPSVNVSIDGLRKNNQGQYMATPVALIPFEGKVIDGVTGQLGGLDRVEYQLTLRQIETSSIAAMHAEWLVGALLPAVGSRWDGLFVAADAGDETIARLQSAAAAPIERTFPLDTFAQMIRDRAARDVPRAELLRRLEQPPPSPQSIPLVREFVVQPKLEGLDLRERLPDLKVKGPLDVQPRYRMRLTVSATDNNIETGPGESVNKEPPFTVIIVSETELLVEIARDEESQHAKTEDAVARLRETRGKLDAVAGELPAADAGQLPTYAQRAGEMCESAVKARDVVQEVFSEYSRILRELELNRVSPKFIEKVKGEIVMPLESALKREFVAAEEALEAYRKELEAGRKPDAKPARVALDRLITKLEQVMASMGEMTTINKLIATLRDIEKGQEQAIAIKLREIMQLQRKKLIDDLNKKGLDDK